MGEMKNALWQVINGDLVMGLENSLVPTEMVTRCIFRTIPSGIAGIVFPRSLLLSPLVWRLSRVVVFLLPP